MISQTARGTAEATVDGTADGASGGVGGASGRPPGGGAWVDAVCSMDDDAVFGPVLYSYPCGQAIDDGWLDDYRVIVIGVRSSEALDILSGLDPDGVTGRGEAPLRTAVTQIALARAAVDYGLRRILVFTRLIAESREFAATFAASLRHLPTHHRPPGPLTVGHVDGTQNVTQQRWHLERLSHPPGGGWTVLSSARCLNQGVDVPAVDGVVFSRPKKSVKEVIQAVGRGLRRNPDGPGVATVLVPLLLPDDPTDLPEADSEWEAVWEVLHALRAHDARLASELDTCRASNGGTTGTAHLPARVMLRLPDGYTTTELLQQVTTRLVEHTTSTWLDNYLAVCAFHAREGHLHPPAGHRENGIDVEQWLRYCRNRDEAGTLPADQRDALTKLDPDWTAPPHLSLRRGLAAANAFRARHGHLNVDVDHCRTGFDLYVWLGYCLTRRQAGTLPPDIEATLDRLGLDWDEVIDWEQGVAAARAFHTRTTHLYVPASHRENGFALRKWLLDCRTIRRRRMLPAAVEMALTELGLVWNDDPKWEAGMSAAYGFYAREGHLQVSPGHREDGFDLYNWLLRVRDRCARDNWQQPRYRAAQAWFTSLDPDWGIPPFRSERGLAAASAFRDREGHLDVPRNHPVNGYALYGWLKECRDRHRRNRLAVAVIGALDALGMRWSD